MPARAQSQGKRFGSTASLFCQARVVFVFFLTKLCQRTPVEFSFLVFHVPEQLQSTSLRLPLFLGALRPQGDVHTFAFLPQSLKFCPRQGGIMIFSEASIHVCVASRAGLKKRCSAIAVSVRMGAALGACPPCCSEGDDKLNEIAGASAQHHQESRYCFCCS